MTSPSGAAGGGSGAAVGRSVVDGDLARFKEATERVGVVFRKVLGAAHVFAAVFGPLSISITALTP